MFVESALMVKSPIITVISLLLKTSIYHYPHYIPIIIIIIVIIVLSQPWHFGSLWVATEVPQGGGAQAHFRRKLRLDVHSTNPYYYT